ncbi:ankyrin repeat domain-containing protein SOWAHD [Aythya fuligula]|uniref:Ankyrin repeat domain-containing protein SOWAHD n=1 Tax=Aythya fuligula TaxID=219594 RepID=A0A6J3DSQ6_AYTFU|nr:ankyrin repeat domain-containing protein SOWAHD [Aythya fuligula]
MARREREQPGGSAERRGAAAGTPRGFVRPEPPGGAVARVSHLWPGAAGSRERPQAPQAAEPGGSWGRAAAGPGSTRRKELKGILQSSTKRSAPAQNQEQEAPEHSPEVLSLALDPLEHEWLLTVAQGDAENIVRLLDLEPSLLTRKDFVTGFTALHWLAKHGHHESFIEVVAHAQKKGYPVNVNIPAASGGLTPLHLAALQGHELLIKLLVGAYGADTSCRDHSGRKAWQYLRVDAPRELKELAGALEEDLAQLHICNTNNNCAENGYVGGIGEVAAVKRQPLWTPMSAWW